MADYQMGGYIEGETPEEYQRRQEEERRRQEALNTPVKETIVTNPDGTQEVTVKGTREALSPANPNTPTLVRPGEAAPVAPDQYAAETERLQRQAQIAQGTPVGAEPAAPTRSVSSVPAVPNIGQLPQFGQGVQTASINPDAGFQRMLQVESGNQNYTPQGTPVTSPKGAMFAAQVMPTTAQNPGYGVRPAQAQTPEEYNRVGADYYQAMLKKYNGNEDMARAAYNAGPGRVDQAIAQGQKLGIDPVSLLPRETQDYIKKTAAPQAEPGVQVASTEPSAGVAEAARIRENNYKVAYEQGQDQGSFDNRFTAASKDPRKLLDLHNDQTLTAEQRQLAGKQAQQLLNQQMGEVKGKQELAGMNENDIARLLKTKSEEGSFAKLLLLGFVSPTLALKEANKLGLNDQWVSSNVGGEPVLFKTRDGVPIEGVSGKTGAPLSSKELVSAAAQITALKGANAGGQVYRDPATGQTLTKVDTQQGPIYFDKAQQRVIPKGEPIPLTAGSDISTQLQMSQMKRQQAFVGQTAAARIQSFKEVNNERALAGMAPLTPDQMGLNPNGELIGQAQPTVPGLAQPAATGAPAVPAVPAVPAAGGVASAAAPAVAPAVPGTAATGQAPLPVAGGAKTPAQMQAERLAAAAGSKTEATKTAENLVADREALPKIESSAENTLRTLNDVLYETDAKGNIKMDRNGRPKPNPGFETNVGVPGITGILQLPGTAARDWQAKYKQLQGQQFLEAFNSLRGGGSITEVEGTKAEQAIAALRDPGISEVEFKRNATILEDTIKRGVDRARAKVGQKPKYDTGAQPADVKSTGGPVTGATSTVDGVTYVYDGKGWKKQ